MKTDNRTWVGLLCSTVVAGMTPTVVAAQDVAAHMHEHYDAVVAIQKAVIGGQLDATRESARWLVEHQAPGGLPPDAEAYVEAMRSAAGDVQNAADLAAAADATARLGLACGGCHTANGVEVEFDESATLLQLPSRMPNCRYRIAIQPANRFPVQSGVLEWGYHHRR